MFIFVHIFILLYLEARNVVRNSFSHTAVITSKVIKGKEEEGAKYLDYFEFSETLNRISSHRLLALRRGETEGILRVSISPDTTGCLDRLKRRFVKGRGETSDQVSIAVDDSFKRLLKPSIETEFANLSKAPCRDYSIFSTCFQFQLPMHLLYIHINF